MKSIFLKIIMTFFCILSVSIHASEIQQEPTMTQVEDLKNDDNDNNSICRICLDKLESELTTTTTPCGHNYHTPCINSWLVKNPKCPTCRTPLKAPLSIKLQSMRNTFTAHAPHTILGALIACGYFKSNALIERMLKRVHPQLHHILYLPLTATSLMLLFHAVKLAIPLGRLEVIPSSDPNTSNTIEHEFTTQSQRKSFFIGFIVAGIGCLLSQSE